MLGRSGSRVPMSQIFLFIMLTIHETPALSRGWNSNQVNSITELLILIFYWAPSAQQVLLRAHIGVSLKLLSFGDISLSLFFPVSLRRHACIKHFAKTVEVHNWIQSKNRGPHLKQKQTAQTNVEQMCLVSAQCLVLSGTA